MVLYLDSHFLGNSQELPSLVPFLKMLGTYPGDGDSVCLL